MSARKSISKKTRFEVFKRDKFACQYCGKHPPDALLQVDHINPVKLGGGNDMDNLITACQACNLGKMATPLTSIPQSLSEKAAEIAEREAQIIGYTEVMDGRRERIEAEAWRIADALIPGASDGLARSKFTSIKTFQKRLGLDECLEAADIANSKYPYNNNRRFLYFCGICWRKIKDIEGQA